jgi:dipeptidyl aminopeptidase/acylaminoacyl peptidase
MTACSHAAPAEPAAARPGTSRPDGPRRYRDPVVQDIVVTRDIEYGSAPGADGRPESLKLDLYEPDERPRRLRPAIVFVHGGGFAGLDKSTGPSSEMAPLFARLGYVVVAINYRLLSPEGCAAPGGKLEVVCFIAAREAIHDAQAAVRWLRVHATERHIDPDRLAIAGESAGAVIAMGVGVWSDEPGNSGNPGPSSAVTAWMSMSGGLPGGLLVDKGDAPGLLFASPDDPIVPYQWSVDSRDALLRAGVHAELVTYEHGGHVPWGPEYRWDIIQRTTDFFYEQLRPEDARASPSDAGDG